MAVLQHYYTSFVNREAGSAGFQVKAMSPGIAPDTQSTITRLISYRIPPTLDEYRLDTHPVALRYYYKSPQEAILLCSQSNGTDENGRPGNFFAHSLVTEPDYFTSMPPILYWHSNFWRTRDTRASSMIEPLYSLDEVECTLDIEGVWNFLAQGNRIEQFYKLMCAVVHYSSTQRRIVIIDDDNNVAQWIAAVTFMLPPVYRPLLSFATYHHDPYQSQFMITGTTTDSSFRASPDEYMSYFILNTKTGQVSDVAESPYAVEAREAARSYDIYENRLLAIIGNYLSRFPEPKQIDEQLDLLASYAAVLEPHHPLSLTPLELEAVSAVLTTLEGQRVFEQEHINELQQLGELLHDLSQSEANEGIYNAYKRVVSLKQQHKIPTDQSALKELKYVTKLLISGSNIEVALQRLNNMRAVYGEAMFLDTINKPNFLEWLSKLPENGNATSLQVKSIWQYLGPYISPGKHSQRFLLASLGMAISLWNDKPRRPEGKALMESMISAMAGREAAWLQIVAESYASLPENALPIFYCKLVEPLDLDQRVRYRTLVRRLFSAIDLYELRNHMSVASNTGIQNGLKALEDWISHAKRQQVPDIPALAEAGIKYLVQITERPAFKQKFPNALNEVAPQILISQVLAPLPIQWENYLVSIALANVSLSRYTRADLEMCRKYREREGLSSETRTIIDGLLAMNSGTLNDELASRLRYYFKQSPHRFQLEAQSFIQTFLPACRDDLSHLNMVNALFTWDYSEYFWPPYWDTLKRLLSQASTSAHALGLLNFWFDTEPDRFQALYSVQYFMLELPTHLEATRGMRGFPESARYIKAAVDRQNIKWFPLVEEYLSPGKNLIASVGLGLASQLQKRLGNAEDAKVQAEKEQRERAALMDKLNGFFDKKQARKLHARIHTLYDWKRRELFWSAYWELFKNVLLSQYAEIILDVLAFWFDDSSAAFEQMPYIPNEFFLHLYDQLATMRKEKGFIEGVRLIHRKVASSPQGTYNWIALVENYLEEPEKKFGFLRR
ncbi:MAG TPA: hypothetical protein VFA41_04740 [Ktedonobacteraceae bacterium]|jgi:hypothetical protein|nr:hypothetical protein [Ktedonobacteraceae bacterium]